MKLSRSVQIQKDIGKRHILRFILLIDPFLEIHQGFSIQIQLIQRGAIRCISSGGSQPHWIWGSFRKRTYIAISRRAFIRETPYVWITIANAVTCGDHFRRYNSLIHPFFTIALLDDEITCRVVLSLSFVMSLSAFEISSQ